MKIAICSPNSETYSETFIKAHVELLKDSVLLYNKGFVPQYLNNERLNSHGFLHDTTIKVFNHFFRRDFSSESNKLYISLKKHKPNVILAEYGPTAVAILPIVKKLRIPLVVHFHGYDASVIDVLNKFSDNYKEIFAFANFIVTVSEVMSQKLISLGCPQNKIIKTCCGPNSNFFNLKPDFKQVIFISVGRFVEKKAPHLTILAFSEIVKHFPEATLNFAGDGPLKNVCVDLVKHLNLEKNIKFLGVLSPEKVMMEMEKSIAFLQHSVTANNGDMEGTPVGILEAQAASIPVISTYHAGIPDVVLHGKTGYLFNEKDVKSMTKYILKIIKSTEEAKKMGKAGRERVREYFTIEHHISKIQMALEIAANKKK